jgi:tRNA1(Val) A37 N6-methylase TrmN6
MLDLGTGKATVALLVARRLPQAQIVGVEAFPQSHALALRNVALNALQDRIEPRLGDLRDPSVLADTAPFDLICGAPPFMPVGTGVLPKDPQRAAGRFELRGGVEAYAACAFRHLARDGTVVLLMDGHGKDRLQASLGAGLRDLIAIVPRPGQAPTYWIGIAGHTAAPCVERVVPMRIGDAWSPAYAALRQALRLDSDA